MTSPAPLRAFPPFTAVARLAAACAAALSCASIRAQVTDAVVVTPYGPSCGVGLTAEDTIQVDGSHAIGLHVNVPPNAPAVLAIGFDQVDVPLPPTGCHLLTDPVGYLLAASNGAGDANFLLSLPASFTERLAIQAGTFDASLAIQTSGGLDLLFPGVSPTADPSVHTEYPCYYFQYYDWNYGGDGVPTVNGKIYWPSNTCLQSDGPPNNLPMIVFLHGNGMAYDDHDYLLSHLARNGFVVCSIQNGSHLGGSNEGRAREAISYLNGMHAFWSYSGRLSNDVVFMGHSRGGEAAVTAARLLAEQPGLMYLPYDVEAVVSIAPTDGGGDNSDPKENLDGTMTRSFLAIYGSRDPDVRGLALLDPMTGPENTAFAIYDRAGTEASVEGLLLPASNLKKAMVFVHGATHRGFLDGCNVLDGGSIGCSSHKDVARSYVTAFLRWQVDNENAYRGYFDGTAAPTKVRIEDIDVFEQFADHPRRVLDNFEQGGWNVNTRGGSVVMGAGIAQIAEDELWQLDPSVPHDTMGLRVKWGGAGSKYVGWNIPIANVPFVGPARDVTNYDVLSLRVAQDYLDAWNTAGQDQDFRVRLFTGNGWSDFVSVSDFGRIPSPDPFSYFVQPFGVGDFTKTAMATIRLPLDAFAGADLSDVQWVYCYFDLPGHTSGSVVMDSLEFSR
jgi:pimeloyl-ACP methyl ester carboxylesterase